MVLENPGYEQVIEANPHLQGVRMDDDDTKKMLPVHIILGANDFAKIRTGERLRVGRRGGSLGLDGQLCRLEPIVAYRLPC